MRSDFIFTSESVTEGHPDKLCDQISDAVVDSYLQKDPFAQVVTECVASTGILFIAARFAAQAAVDIPAVARRVIGEIGYRQPGFDAESCSILTSFTELPAGEHEAVDERGLDDDAIEAIAAKNQVTVFGFACRQTASLMPLPVVLAHRLARRLAAVRLTGLLRYLAPDGKTQVAVQYADGRPHRIHGLTLIVALDPERAPGPARVDRDLREAVIEAVFADEPIRPDAQTRVLINPGGPFVIGGPAMHAGLTGRKTAIDTYGEYARHSGAALSGKDPTRIDRVGAYAGRYAAKTVVAAGLADECEVQLSYSIGLARPVSVHVETFGTGRIADREIAARVVRHFDFRPAAIIAAFDLRRAPSIVKGGFYRRLASYGHVGRMDIGLPWERTDKAERLR